MKMKSETVALNKKHQGKFARKVSKLKKKVEKGEVKIQPQKQPESGDTKGLVYIKHLPHGFYESELQSFFGQFGKVTNTRVCRSQRNGRSKGYGFVEFKDDDVAKIAAESMNNYLMFKKKIETKHVPADKRHKKIFSGKPWKPNQVPRMLKVKRVNQEKNLNVSKGIHLKRAKNQLDKINQKLKKLAALGIQHSIQAVNDPTKPLLSKTPDDITSEESLTPKVKTLKKKVVEEKKKSEDKEKLLSENDFEDVEEKVVKKKIVGKKGLIGAVEKMKVLGENKGLKKIKTDVWKVTKQTVAKKPVKIVAKKSETKKVGQVKKAALKNGFFEEVVEEDTKKSFEKKVGDKKSLKTILKKKDKISGKKEGKAILKSDKMKLAAKKILDNSDLVVKKTKKSLKKAK